MSDDASLRRSNLRALRMTPGQLAQRTGRTYSYFRDLLENPTKSFGEKAARSIEASLGLPRGWLDEAHLEARPATHDVREPTASYSIGERQAVDELTWAIAILARALRLLPAEARDAAASTCSGWARSGGDQYWARSLAAILQTDDTAPKIK